MPALGNRGVVSPREIAKGAKQTAPKIAKLPATKISFQAQNRTNQLLRPASQAPEQQTPQERRAFSPLNVGLRKISEEGTRQATGKTPFQLKSAAQEAKQRQKAEGGLSLATIANIPGQIEAKGYANIAHALGTSTIGGKLASGAGKLAAEAINIPAQALPAAYHVSHGIGEAIKGNPEELHELGKALAKESAVAHLVKGDFAGAAKAAGAHPIGTALEATGAAGAVDRTLGALGRLSGVDAARLADSGVATTSRAPKEYPVEAVPKGGVTVAQRPYHKGLVRPTIEKARPHTVPTGRIKPNLRRAVDRFEGEQLSITRRDRDLIAHEHAKLIKGVGKTHEAMTSFGQWLADPKAINPETERPFHQEHLQEAIEHFSKPPSGELPDEKITRQAVVSHLKDLQGKDLTKAYGAALKRADQKRALEPELTNHGVYTPETIRAAKLIPAFRFHFRDQNPFVDTTVPAGESPFRLGGPEGKQVSPGEVAQKLESKGVHEKQLSFSSSRPFQNGNAVFRSGHYPGGAKVAKGHLTGSAFMKGLFDPTSDASLRQYLTDKGIINRARGDLRLTKGFVHTREQVAKLLEARMGRLEPHEQAAMRDYIQKDLRGGPELHFETKGNRAGGQRVLKAREQLKTLYPDIQLEPIRVAHPYATKQYREAMGKHLDLAETQDMLDPANHGPEQEFWKTRVPTEQSSFEDRTAGPWGLVHQEVRDRLRAHENDLGQAHLARMPSSFWRRANVAYSIRHVPGVTQEVALRMAANNVGALSAMRGTRALHEILAYGHAHPDPLIKNGAQRLEAIHGGTVSSQALEQLRHVTREQMAASKFGKPAEWWYKGEARKISGAPLRAVRGAVKAFNGTTNRILRIERRYIEHPPQVAGLGKHLNNEFKAMHGKRLKFIGAFNDVEKAFLRGQLDPKAIDHAAAVGREYWGDWTRSSPEYKKLQAAVPFAQWYQNSLRFLYHTMPVHHPVKTGLLTAMEGATREQRLAEGQEYKGGLPFGTKLLPTDLEASQQGSMPNFLGNPKTERVGAEYYSPMGAISAGPLETLQGAVLPFASGIWMVSRGINPLTNKPLEEKNDEGKKEPIKDQNQLALLAALSAGESFFPPLRYAQSLSKKPASYVFRPLRTEKARTEKPEKKIKGSTLGGKIGGSIGGSIGGKLP